jgi:hypothetical protein
MIRIARKIAHPSILTITTGKVSVTAKQGETRGRPAKFPWATMNVGESFFVTNACLPNSIESRNPNNEKKIFCPGNGSNMVKNTRWSGRTVNVGNVEGVRCWRIA